MTSKWIDSNNLLFLKALVENLVACSRSMEHLKRMLVQLHATSLPHERSGEDQQIVC